MMQFHRGFTLVEVAIAILLIGLLLSGVLVGKDLIEAAQIRRTIGEVEKINTAVYTFKNKFNALPGDIPSRIALNNGLTAYIVNPGDTDFLGLGDGDGIIAPRIAKYCTGEQALFFIQLNEAKLLNYAVRSQYLYLDYGGNTGGVSEDLDTTEKASTLFPLSSLSGKTHLMIATPHSSYISTNDVYLTLTGISAIGFSGSVLTTTISPRIAHSIDIKTDDGMPESGNTLAMNEINNSPIALGLVSGDSSAECIATSGSITHYNYMIGAYADRPNCHIAFKTRY